MNLLGVVVDGEVERVDLVVGVVVVWDGVEIGGMF